MIIGLVSDTHMPRFGKAVPEPVRRGFTEAGVELILHAGDFTSMEIVPLFEAIAPFDAVAGNNDGPDIVARFGRRKVVEAGSIRIGLVHGDGVTGKTLDRAIAAFKDEPVDVVVFGHSHQPYCQQHGDLWVVNPGSPTDRRFGPTFGYGLLRIEKGSVTPYVHTYTDRFG